MQQFVEFAGNHFLLVAGFVAVALALLVTEFTRRGQGFKLLSPNEAVAFINRDGAAIVDVSSAADFNKGHILDARNIPLSRFKDPDPDISKLIKKPVLVTCKSGQTAQQAAASLVKQGADNVAVLRGGMAQWVSDNFPVTRR